MCSSPGGSLGHIGAPECSLSERRLYVCPSRAVGGHERGRGLGPGWGKSSTGPADQMGGVMAKKVEKDLSGGSLWACGGAQTLGC